MTRNRHGEWGSRRRRWGRFWTSPLLLLLAACATPERSAEGNARSAAPLLVLGIDGATWDVIDPMIAKGELPHVAALIERGTRGDLVAMPPLSSPVVWTTFATGFLPRQHFVLDHVAPYAPGPKRPVSSLERRKPALWNIASARQKTVTVLGYYGTHPPDPVNGLMISNRFVEGAAGGVHPSAREQFYGESFRQLLESERGRQVRDLYLPWDFDWTAADDPEAPFHEATKVAIHRLNRRPLFDTFIADTTVDVVREGGWDIAISYLRMIDHASHATWKFFDDFTFAEPADPELQQLFAEAIPTAYRQVDELLGRLASDLPEVNVIVLSDHGFGPSTGDWAINRSQLQHLSGNHRPVGILIAAGPDIRSGQSVELIDLDVAPTLLALADLPISEEMPGRVVNQLFARAPQPRYVASYGDAWRTVEQAATEGEPDDADEADADRMRSLEALGYIGGGTKGGAPTAVAREDFWSIQRNLRLNVLMGEILFHLSRDRFEEAVAVLEECREHDEELALQLPRLLRKTARLWQADLGRHLLSQAVRERFDATFALGPQEPGWEATQ